MARVVEAKESRLRVERRPEGLHLGLPRRRAFTRYFIPAWIALIWSLGLVQMITGEPPEDSGGVWFIVLWFVFGAVAFSLAVWGSFHREELLLDSQHLTHRRAVGPIRRVRSYVRERVEDPRLSTESASPFDLRGMSGGTTIAFDYGDRTVRLGDVEEAEAKRVLAALETEGLR